MCPFRSSFFPSNLGCFTATLVSAAGFLESPRRKYLQAPPGFFSTELLAAALSPLLLSVPIGSLSSQL
jgi:hypothetical protein